MRMIPVRAGRTVSRTRPLALVVSDSETPAPRTASRTPAAGACPRRAWMVIVERLFAGIERRDR